MSSPIPLSSIPTLPTLYAQSKLSPSATPTPPSPHTPRISLIRTDITTLSVSAIVNAANTSLLGGGGVDGAIHRAAGPGLLRECRTLDGCETGSAKMTDAYDLPCEKVVHAVGPVYGSAVRKGGVEEAARLLAGCYTTSLDLMSQAGLGSIAFSALSTGVYGYPSGEAAEVAVRAVKGWLDADGERAGKVERIVFCSFLEKDERAYEEVVPNFFPPESEEEASKDDETSGDVDGTAKSKKEATVSDLPDVPKDEPKEPGQPDHKKAKLDEGEA